MCEGFLGIGPHFNLWWYFFAVTLLKKREKKQELSTPMGCIGIQLRNNWVSEYPAMRMSTSNKGWHSHWFYIKNDAVTPCQSSPSDSSKRSQNRRGSGESQRKIRRESRTMSPPSKF